MDRVKPRSYLRGVMVLAVSVAAASAQSPVFSDSQESPLAAFLPEAAIPAIDVSQAPALTPLKGERIMGVIPDFQTHDAAIQALALTPLKGERIMGVIPDFQTVRDPNAAFVPLTPKQKWSLAFRENVDPFNIASAAMAARSEERTSE